MRLMVTGGAGFIGSALIRMAVGDGHAVLNVDSLSYASCLDNLSSVAHRPQYSFARGDVLDGPFLDRSLFEFQPDAVIHLAAESHVDRSIDGPLDFVRTNVLGTANLLVAVRDYWDDRGRPDDFRFLHVSTDEVFGALGPTGRFCEHSPYAPNSPYAASKASSDHLVRAWGHTYGLPVLTTNCSNNYGPFQFPEKLIPVVILKALAGRPIPVYGTGNQMRDWLYVDDHVRGLLAVLARGEPGERFVLGSGQETRNIDLVQRICAILDQRRPRRSSYARQISFVEDRPGHDFRYALDTTRARTALNWTPLVGLDEGLEQTVSWYLENSDWARSLGNEENAEVLEGVAV